VGISHCTLLCWCFFLKFLYKMLLKYSAHVFGFFHSTGTVDRALTLTARARTDALRRTAKIRTRRHKPPSAADRQRCARRISPQYSTNRPYIRTPPIQTSDALSYTLALNALMHGLCWAGTALQQQMVIRQATEDWLHKLYSVECLHIQDLSPLHFCDVIKVKLCLPMLEVIIYGVCLYL